MSEHGLTFINDDFELNLTLKNATTDDWADTEFWGRLVAAVMDQVRYPIIRVGFDNPEDLTFGPAARAA